MSGETTLGELARALATTHRDKTALRFEGVDTSFTDLDQRSDRIANGLVAMGIGPGERISYLGKNNPCYYELLFGAAKAGAVMTPINWRLADGEIGWIMHDAETRLVVTGPEFTGRLRGLYPDRLGAPVILDSDNDYADWRDGQSSDAPTLVDRPDDVAVQLYTSGTTGRPKGAMLTHRNLLVYRTLPTDAQPAWNRFVADDVSLIVMPMFHIGGTGFGIQTLAAGATGLVAREFDADQVIGFIEHERLSKIFVVPSALQMLLRHPHARSIDYGRIRTILYGASPIPLELLREAMAVFGCGFVQMYGMTETSGTICALTPEDHDPEGNAVMRSAGRALAGVELRIVDTDGVVLPSGTMGEISVRAPLVMRGYWKLPDDTSAALSPEGWFLTGDAGYLDPEGYLFIQDRVKDMIVTGGENVYPAEVEQALYGHPTIAEVAVIGIPSDKWGEEVKAIIVAEAGSTPDPVEIIGWARSRIAGYKLPKSIDFVEALPRGPTGKILRRSLREPYWANRSSKVN